MKLTLRNVRASPIYSAMRRRKVHNQRITTPAVAVQGKSAGRPEDGHQHVSLELDLHSQHDIHLKYSTMRLRMSTQLHSSRPHS